MILLIFPLLNIWAGFSLLVLQLSAKISDQKALMQDVHNFCRIFQRCISENKFKKAGEEPVFPFPVPDIWSGLLIIGAY